MKRYDTHRNFPPSRRPRDSTPAPPEDDELEKLLTASNPVLAEAPVVSGEGDGEREGIDEFVVPPAVPSSVESALTAYVESLPASDPEPRIEEREIDVDAEAAGRAASTAGTHAPEPPAQSASAAAVADDGDAAVVQEKRSASKAQPARAREDEDDEDDEDEDASLAPPSSRPAESAAVDSIAAIAGSTAPAATAKRGASPVLWVAGFALAGIALALWSMRKAPEVQEKARVHAASPATELDAPVLLGAAPAPIEPTPVAVPSGSAAPVPAVSAVPQTAASAFTR